MSIPRGAVTGSLVKDGELQCQAQCPFPSRPGAISNRDRCRYRAGHHGPHFTNWTLWREPSAGER